MPYGSIDFPAQDRRRTVGSRCHVLHSKWRQSFWNDSISALSIFSFKFFALIIECRLSLGLRAPVPFDDVDALSMLFLQPPPSIVLWLASVDGGCDVCPLVVLVAAVVVVEAAVLLLDADKLVAASLVALIAAAAAAAVVVVDDDADDSFAVVVFAYGSDLCDDSTCDWVELPPENDGFGDAERIVCDPTCNNGIRWLDIRLSMN